MTRTLSLRQADDRRDVVHEAVRALAEGQIVALPTETVYVLAASAVQGAAVRRLGELVEAARSLPASIDPTGSNETGANGTGSNGAAFAKPEAAPPSSPIADREQTDSDRAGPRCVLAVKGAAEARDYLAEFTPLSQKLSRRCWPGPLALEFGGVSRFGLLAALPTETQAALLSGGSLRLRVAAHEFVSNVLRLSSAPLVFSPERIGQTQPFRTLKDLDVRFGYACELLVDDGACRYGEPSTVVRVERDRWSLAARGVVTETAVGRLASEVYLFVCTGNTCRSPMAEALFRKMLAERLKCPEEDLFDRGYVVASAGISAAPGAAASAESVAVATRLGADLRGHESQPLTERLLEQADRVFTMTRHHRESILSVRPDLAGRVELLSRDRRDISDPIGGTMGDYDRCAQEIQSNLRSILDDLPGPLGKERSP